MATGLYSKGDALSRRPQPASVRSPPNRWRSSLIPARGKICGAYVNSALAGDEARRNGFDELFFTGTAVEIAPEVKVDYRPVGTGAIRWIAAALRGLYTEATCVRMAGYRDWVVPVYRPAGIKAA